MRKTIKTASLLFALGLFGKARGRRVGSQAVRFRAVTNRRSWTHQPIEWLFSEVFQAIRVPHRIRTTFGGSAASEAPI